jgi:peptidoglycan/LPS O-acetylase OafA/YrhL
VRLAATASFGALLIGGLGLVFSSWTRERPLVVWPAVAATMLLCGALIGAFGQGKRWAREGALVVFVTAILVQAVALVRQPQGGPISLCLIGQLALVAIALGLLYGRRSRRWFASAGGQVSVVEQIAEREEP